jgi:hypothetical protein
MHLRMPVRVTCRQSRVAGHGSPVTARRSRLAAKRGEWRGGKLFPFSSLFWSAAPVAGNVPQSKTSRYFPESRHSFPKTCRNFPSSNRYFAESNRPFAKSRRSFWESSHYFAESSGYFWQMNGCFPSIFPPKPLIFGKIPGFWVVSGGEAGRQPFSNLS